MRARWWSLALWMAGCGSENKVDDALTPPRHTQTSGETTPESTPTPDTGAPSTDSPNDTATTDDPDTTNPDTTPIDPPTDITEEEICEKAAALTITLDPYQTPGDGRVYYCHSGSGNSYTYIETDISSCLPHLNHSNDIFPTSGCDS